MVFKTAFAIGFVVLPTILNGMTLVGTTSS